ncbi:MAG TPA: hypothetical protein VIY27_08345 [Myxococcota bacterium]
MSVRTPPLGRTHHFWGQFADLASLPNVLGSPTQSPPIGGVNVLQAGDVAWSIADACLAVCEDPTSGAAVWKCVLVSGGPGAGSIIYWGNDRINGTGVRQYLTPGYDDQVAKFITGRIQIPAPDAGTLRDMTVYFNRPYTPPPPVTGVLDFVLAVNGIDTPLKVTGVPADTVTVTQNTTDVVAIAAGDLMAIAVDKRDPANPPPPPINIDTPEGIVVTFRWT